MSALAPHSFSVDYLDMLTDIDDADIAAVLDGPNTSCNSDTQQSAMIHINTAVTPVRQQSL